IPEEPEKKESKTVIYFYERRSLMGVNDYKENCFVNLTTTLPKEESTFKEVVEENSGLMGLLIIIGLLLSYLWNARHYYFLVPFYTNIPEDKLLNHEKRGKIADFLHENNGSTLTKISEGTGINKQTLRHHMRLFAQSDVVLKKDKRFFIREKDRHVFDTEILSPVLQRVLEVIMENEGITVTQLKEATGRSKPWVGKRLRELLVFDLIEIVQPGRYKHIYLKSSSVDRSTQVPVMPKPLAG
ncbi:MAG: helix-turn-helix transcriptional regulator, partial [Thermoplasmata archaeon]|nr:helix-turn-helix transcriptional regulator [Thermoplasmata archaeon]